jgi:uncharacterized membrane protein YjgN (DUF898 family)
LVKNAFLTCITLGIYRFWARAALRRYWWGSVVIAGDALEYTGTGLELFIGFLMFLAIMLPFGVIYGLTSLLQASNPIAGGLLRMVEALIFFVLIQFVTFRARRYRLSRTLWRGVRASQGGTSGEYLRLVIKWTLLSTVTLGIAAPWARIATTRYLMDRTALGDLVACFDGRGRDLLAAWITPYLLIIGSVALFFVINVDLIGKFKPGVAPHGLWVFFLGYFAGIISLLAYFLVELRYTIRHTRFGEVQLGSALSIGGVIGTIIGFIVAAFVLFFVVALAMGLTLGFLGFHPGPGQTLQLGPIVAGLVIAVVAAMLIGILRILWVDRGIVRRLCDTMSLTNPERLDRIGQSTAPIPKAGEGMADAFDIGAF